MVAPATNAAEARYLRPERQRLAECMTIVTGSPVPSETFSQSPFWLSWWFENLAAASTDDPDDESVHAAAGWEAIAPPEWLGDARRAFVVQERPTAEGTASRSLAPYPSSVRHAVTLASDPRGVTTAEALAREVVARMRPWAAPQPTVVAWNVARAFLPTTGLALGPAIYALDRVIARPEAAAVLGRYPRPWWAPDYARLWTHACTRGYRAPESRAGVPEPRAFARLPDPFEPLLGVLAAGYELEAIRDDAVVLFATEVG